MFRFHEVLPNRANSHSVRKRALSCCTEVRSSLTMRAALNVPQHSLADGGAVANPAPAHHRVSNRVRRAVGESALFNRENA